MSFFKSLFSLFGAGRPKPQIIEVGGKLIDISGLPPEQRLALLEQRDGELAINLLELEVEQQRLAAALDYEGWQLALKSLHGEQVGQKLIDQEIEVGMTTGQLTLSFGYPDDIASEGEFVLFIYGIGKNQSTIKLLDGVIAAISIGTKPPPPTHFAKTD